MSNPDIGRSCMLVNAAEMLKKAEAGHYALGAFNTNNLEWTLAILQAAEEAKSPLILQCTAGAAKWMGGFKVCADMVKAAVEATGVTVPVALHLDHGSYEDCFKCIEAGFTSIMYDGSHEETFQINLDRTKELVELAHSKGMSIEAGKDQQGKGFDPRKLLKPGREAIVARTKELMEEFASVNKA